MSTKSKAKGTAAETAVVMYLRANGFGGAERRALHGSLDLGDILVCPGVIAEVKAGKAAHNASDNQFIAWHKETVVEQRNARADEAFLVVQRPYKNVSHWWVFAVDTEGCCHWLRLKDTTYLLRRSGYGDPLD